MPKETFRDSFRPHHVLKTDAVCGLKKHYKNVLREVVGYLDLLASNDAERFAFASVPNITKHCNKFSKGRAPYQQRQVENALEFLREQFVISGRIERKRLGTVRSGFIVTPHDALCARTKNCCEFKGAGFVPGTKFQTKPGARCWWWVRDDAAAMPQHSDSNAGGDRAVSTTVTNSTNHETAASLAVRAAAIPAVGPAVRAAVLNQKSGVQGCGEGCGTTSLQAKETQSDYPAGTKVFPTFCASTGAPNLVNHSTVKAEVSVIAVDDGNQGVSAEASSKSMNDETIGQHFGVPWLPTDSFIDITEGVLNTDTKQWDDFGYESIRNLRDCCNDVIREFAEQPYLGRETHALVMDLAMQRFNGTHGKVPTSWFKVMTTLRKKS